MELNIKPIKQFLINLLLDDNNTNFDFHSDMKVNINSFLWYPLIINNKLKWMETATWIQRPIVSQGKNKINIKWKNVEWVE